MATALSQPTRSLSVIERVADIRALVRKTRRNGGTVGFVPTMGYLHEGHLSLVRAAQSHDLVIVSIYVNPTQFGPNEDLDQYPRDLDGDCRKAAEAGADVVFTPHAEEMYPGGLPSDAKIATWVTVPALSQQLCATDRPTHFRGVATVVTKLFNIVQPDVAYFGEKDYQQLTLIRQMTSDLCMPVQIVGVPIVREADGLAMSSRNAYLNEAERAAATVLVEALRAVWDSYHLRTERDPGSLLGRAQEVLAAEPLARPQYVELVNNETLLPVASPATANDILALAVRIGDTRLIDNLRLGAQRP